MKQKIGRNDSCLCGSGKKYKKCCMRPEVDNQIVTDLIYKRLRNVEGAIIDKHLMPYVLNKSKGILVSYALDDFVWEPELPEEIEPEVMFHQIIMPWILFNWIGEDIEVEEFNPKLTIAQNYLQRNRTRLNQHEIDFIEAISQSYFSFYSVLEVSPGEGLHVKDCILSTEHRVTEYQGTHTITRGSILFGRLLNLKERTMFVGILPFAIPPGYQTELVHFKQWLVEENEGKTLSQKDVRDVFSDDLFDYCYEIMVRLYNLTLPKMCTTDGDSVEFHTSYFKLSISPEAALKCLLPMALTDNAEEFLSDATRDDSGNVTHIEFPWLKKGNSKHKSWQSTIMGYITINKGKLKLDTNSQQRCQQGSDLLKEFLGNHIQFQKTSIQTFEQMLASEPATKNKSSSSNFDNDEELLSSPEIQAQFKAMSKAHWENWFDEEIPALNYQTPREAVKSKSGRELLEALLLQYEAQDAASKNNMLAMDINYIKRELGLVGK